MMLFRARTMVQETRAGADGRAADAPTVSRRPRRRGPAYPDEMENQVILDIPSLIRLLPRRAFLRGDCGHPAGGDRPADSLRVPYTRSLIVRGGCPGDKSGIFPPARGRPDTAITAGATRSGSGEASAASQFLPLVRRAIR